MDRDRDLHFFRQMMLDCCGLWSWTLNGNLRLLFTNCPNPNPLDGVLLSRPKQEGFKQHISRSRMPLMLGGSFGMSWLAVFQPDEQGEVELIHVLGPAFQAMVPDQTLVEMVQPLELVGSQKRRVLEGIRTVPVVSSVHMFRYATLLHYCVTGEVIGVSDLVHFEPRSNDWHPIEEQEAEPHTPTIHEKLLLDMVRTGNLHYQDALAKAALSSPGIRLQGRDPLRQAQYSVAAFITLCTRAAIEGGLPSDTAYSLSDAYTEAVDQCSSIAEITNVSHTMYEDFIRRVNRCQSDGVSRGIRACREYIDAHAEERLTTKELAGLAGYSDYYLTRKFKKEMGMSLSDYIRYVKVQRAKALLTTTPMSVEDIAAHLRFSSRGYFTEAFQKVEGLSPSEYREAQRRT